MAYNAGHTRTAAQSRGVLVDERAFTYHTPGSTYQLPIGNVSLDAYCTDPGHSPGCAAHADPDCLCDVDVSKTAGMTFDNPPPEFMGALDVQTLLVAGCRIWIEQDLRPNMTGGMFDHRPNLKAMSEDELAEVVAFIRTGASLKATQEQFDIDRHEYTFVRRVCEVTPPSGKGKALSGPMRSKLFKLNAQGLTVKEIITRVQEEEGVTLHDKTIRRIFKAAGVKSNPAPNPIRDRRAAA